MKVELPELDGLIARIETLEDIINGLQAAGKGPLKKQWYSVKDAAVYLECSVKTVRRLIQRGLLRKSLGLRHIRIPAEELQQYKQKTTT